MELVQQGQWMKPKTLDGVQVVTPDQLVTITPNVAEKLLEYNKNFRNLRPGLIQKYAAQMTGGKWEPNGVPIIFNGDGTLVDGQHRLKACVDAGVSFDTVVFCGGSDNGVDEPAKRTLHQWLGFCGVKNAKQVASIIRFIYHYKNKPETWKTGVDYLPSAHRSTVQRPSNKDLMDYFFAHEKRIERSALVINSPDVSGLIEPKLIGGLHYLFAEKDADMALLYVKGLYGHMALDEDDPVLLLRRRLLQEVAAKERRRSSHIVRMGLCIKAWNLWCRGEVVSRLQFKASGPRQEMVPEIETPQK